MKERLDRFLFIYILSGSPYGRNNMNPVDTLASKLTQLPTGWWLPSSQTSIELQVSQLVTKLIESLRSDHITATMSQHQSGERSSPSNLHAYTHLHHEPDPAHLLMGRQASILARFQAAQHLCKYSGSDFSQVFSTSIEEPGKVLAWLLDLSNRWSTFNRNVFRVAST